MTYLSNAFSLQMAPNGAVCERVCLESARAEARAQRAISIVGHADTAKVIGNLLGMDVAFNRQSITLGADDRLIVGQYVGPRLPEGTSVLPEGARIDWYRVSPQQE